MPKIGIMGGTFNPIHLGHLMMAEQSYEQFQLDQVMFMPSKNPPHKNNKSILPESQRVDMIQLAIEGNTHFALCDIELNRLGITYTADTLRILKEKCPMNEYFFILGADSFFQITTWKEPDVIMKMVILSVASRYDLSQEDMLGQAKFLQKHFGARIEFLEIPTIGISSMEIRKRRKEGKSIRYFVTDKVYQYIIDRHLYQT